MNLFTALHPVPWGHAATGLSPSGINIVPYAKCNLQHSVCDHCGTSTSNQQQQFQCRVATAIAGKPEKSAACCGTKAIEPMRLGIGFARY